MPKFSVKSTMYLKVGSLRGRQVDGPWKPTAEEAIKAYAAKLFEKGLGRELVFQPFLAEECPKETAPASDGKKFYRDRTDLQATLDAGLKAEGLRLGSEA